MLIVDVYDVIHFEDKYGSILQDCVKSISKERGSGRYKIELNSLSFDVLSDGTAYVENGHLNVIEIWHPFQNKVEKVHGNKLIV